MEKVRYLPIINKASSYKIEVSDICYVERDDRRVVVVTDRHNIWTYAKLDSIEKYFGGRGFVRLLDGVIINVSRIESMHDSSVFFDNGKVVHLGRDVYIRAKQLFNAYLRDLMPETE